METTVPEFLGSTSCFGTLLRQGQAAAGQGLCSQRGLGARQDASVAHRLGQGCTRQSSRHSDPCSRLCRPAVPSTETYSPEFKSSPTVPFGASFSCTDRTHFPKVFFFGGGHAMWHARSSFPNQGSNPNPCPLQWKHRVLTTGSPGKSLS